MAVNTKKNAAAVALGRKGGKKGGPARAAKLTPEQRSDSARKAVQARWAKAKEGSDYIVGTRTTGDDMTFKGFQKIDEVSHDTSGVSAIDTSDNALLSVLRRLKQFAH